MRYFITLSYDGAAFHGWQLQPNSASVQGCLEHALSCLLGTSVSVTGAGRTDAGVNAMNYAAHFDSDRPVECAEQFRYKLNAMLPKEMVVHTIVECPPDLHARFDATKREYTYFIHTNKDPFVRNYSLLYTYPLDFERMNRAAALLMGRHDFSCFQKIGSDVKTPICTVFEAYWAEYTPAIHSIAGINAEKDVQYWYFRISADRFLRNMVRAIVGTLLELGRGKRSEEDFAALILDAEAYVPGQETKAAARSLAGESVPGNALFLSAVEYPKRLKSQTF